MDHRSTNMTPGSRRDMESLHREEVTFHSGGHLLSAYFFPPVAGAGMPAPGIVFCTGFSGTKQGRESFVAPLVSDGYAVLVMDHRGWGQSGGESGEIYPLSQVEDIRSGLTYLESRTEVRSDRLGLLGVSFGGANAMYVAGVDERVLAVASVSGIGDGRDWLHSMRPEWQWRELLDELRQDRRDRVTGGAGRRVDPTDEIMVATPERKAMKGSGSSTTTPLACAEAIIEYRPVDMVPRITPRAALWLCVDGDPVVPASHSRRMYEVGGPPKKIVEFHGGGHYEAYDRFYDDIFAHTLDWFERHIRQYQEPKISEATT